MCGIAGIFNINTQSPFFNMEKNINLLLKGLEHRGPDSKNIEVTNDWTLGVLRLSIIDLSNKNNIFKAADGNIVFVVNGEIFNYLSLRKELVSKGYRFKSNCDSEVVGFLYQEYGLEFINMLNGQFAIAIIDQIKKKLVLIRDRFGIIPLFYYSDKYRCFFASELRAFKEINEIKREFNTEAMDQLFTFWTTIGSATFLKNIYQVRHSHYVEIDANGVKETKYYNLDLSSERVNSTMTFKEACDGVREHLSNAIIIRLETSDVEVGTYLSGGVDSSIITKVCEKSKKDRLLTTFSICFSDPLYSERKYQETILKESNLKNLCIDISYNDILNNFEKSIDYAGSPIFRTALVPMSKLSNLVHEDKIKVVITGEGADEVFWGYNIFKEAKIRRFWARNPDSKYRALLFKKLYSYLPHFDSKYNTFVASFYKKTLRSKDTDFYSHLVRWDNNSALKALFSQDVKEELKGYDSTDLLRSTLPKNFKKYSCLSKCQYLEMETLLPGYLLSSQGDRMTSMNSVEARVPFLDHNVVEYSASMPEHYKLKSLEDKYILRKAFQNELPDSISNRHKQAYQAPEMKAFSDYCKGSYVEELLSERIVKEIGLFDSRSAGKLLKKLLNGASVSRFSTRDNMALAQILSTHIFYSNYVKKIY